MRAYWSISSRGQVKPECTKQWQLLYFETEREKRSVPGNLWEKLAAAAAGSMKDSLQRMELDREQKQNKAIAPPPLIVFRFRATTLIDDVRFT